MVNIKNGVWHTGDTFDVMQTLPSSSVDMILCDLPYGTTACKWDAKLPFDRLWAEYWRLAKPSAAIVLTAAQPFTSSLIMSQIEKFKYCWIWYKNQPTGFGAANFRPMSCYEDIAVFCRSKTIYNKQPTLSRITDRKLDKPNRRGLGKNNGAYGLLNNENHRDAILSSNVNPRNVIEINIEPRSKGTIHPTQKPFALFEYLIRTYTNEGDTVLDNTAGSGTTAVAAEASGRRWICIERDEEYSCKAIERINALPLL